MKNPTPATAQAFTWNHENLALSISARAARLLALRSRATSVLEEDFSLNDMARTFVESWRVRASRWRARREKERREGRAAWHLKSSRELFFLRVPDSFSQMDPHGISKFDFRFQRVVRVGTGRTCFCQAKISKHVSLDISLFRKKSLPRRTVLEFVQFLGVCTINRVFINRLRGPRALKRRRWSDNLTNVRGRPAAPGANAEKSRSTCTRTRLAAKSPRSVSSQSDTIRRSEHGLPASVECGAERKCGIIFKVARET